MTEHLTVRPDPDEFASFYAGYVAAVPDGDIVATLHHGAESAPDVLSGISETSEALRAYAPGKWTLKEVVLHCADAERIFAYRALRIARGDTTELAGWDEKAYTPLSAANDRPFPSLVTELGTVRAATLTLFEGLRDDAWSRRGRANGQEVTVRALAWITAGHLLHHLGIIQERYLTSR